MSAKRSKTYRDCQKKFKCLLEETEQDNEQLLVESDEMQETTQPNKTRDEPSPFVDTPNLSFLSNDNYGNDICTLNLAHHKLLFVNV